MKKLYTLSLLMVGALSFGQISEPFTTPGTLNGYNGWIKHSGATAGQLQISSGSLSYTGLSATGGKLSIVSGNTEDVNKPSAANLTGVVYYSAVINVLNTTGLAANTATGDYFLMTSATSGDGVAPNPQVTSFSGRLYVRTGSVADTFNVGVLNNSGGTAAPTFTGTDYAINTPIFIVVKYDLSTNTASLYVNPAIGSSEGTAAATNATGTTAAPAQIAAIAVRQGTSTGNIEIDELRMNSTWASVTSADLASTKNFDTISGLKLFPNPLSGNVLNVTSNSNADKTIAVYDVLGKNVLNAKVTNETVNVSALNSGVYIVKITEEGRTATRKLVVK